MRSPDLDFALSNIQVKGDKPQNKDCLATQKEENDTDTLVIKRVTLSAQTQTLSSDERPQHRNVKSLRTPFYI